MFDIHTATLSDFCQLPIGVRPDGTATVVVGGNIGLIGFSTDPKQKDFDIQEEAFFYAKKLVKQLTNKSNS